MEGVTLARADYAFSSRYLRLRQIDCSLLLRSRERSPFSFPKTSRPDIAQLVRQYDQSLSDKDRRRLAAREALPLGPGGIRSSAQVLACAPQTVTDGMRERPPRPDDPAGSRVRTPGGGRTNTAVTHADLLQPGPDPLKARLACGMLECR